MCVGGKIIVWMIESDNCEVTWSLLSITDKEKTEGTGDFQKFLCQVYKIVAVAKGEYTQYGVLHNGPKCSQSRSRVSFYTILLQNILMLHSSIYQLLSFCLGFIQTKTRLEKPPTFITIYCTLGDIDDIGLAVWLAGSDEEKVHGIRSEEGHEDGAVSSW